MEDEDLWETDRVVDWVLHGNFQRVALQFPDSLLGLAPRVVKRLESKLLDCKVFVLGDSAHGSGGVDEVGAEHYGAECLVHFGHSDQQQGGALPTLFVFGKTAATDAGSLAAMASNITQTVLEQFQQEASLLLLPDISMLQAASALAPLLRLRVLIAEPQLETVSQGMRVWHDWRFGSLCLADAWWARLGPLTRAAAARPEPIRVCGRLVRNLGDQKPILRLPEHCGILYLGAAGALERRLLLRHGARPIWRLDGLSLERLSNQALLLRRYRFVELVKAASTVGILMVTSGGAAALGRVLAPHLESLLRRHGRKSYRFLVGRPSAEKLGNFPGIECYVCLSGPEQFPFDDRDLPVPVATPYELDVALGAREWTGEYICDLEELLQTMPPDLPAPEDAAPVQTLGAGARMRSFGLGGDRARALAPEQATPAAAAMATPGLHGVPWRYDTEAGL